MTMTCGTAAELLCEPDRVSGPSPAYLAQAKRIAAATGRILLAALFVVAGLMKLAATDFEVSSFGHFGYALWFMHVIGGIELAGGLMLLAPSLAALGALAMMPIMVGAAFTHLLAGDPLVAAVPPIVVLILLGWLAYARRSDITGQ